MGTGAAQVNKWETIPSISEGVGNDPKHGNGNRTNIGAGSIDQKIVDQNLDFPENPKHLPGKSLHLPKHLPGKLDLNDAEGYFELRVLVRLRLRPGINTAVKAPPAQNSICHGCYHPARCLTLPSSV